MNTELIIKPEDQAMIDAIKSIGKSWYEMALPDHPIYPQFARKLVVTGFNTPDMEGDEERIYVNVRQYLILKDGNVIHKRLTMPNWQIHEGNVEEIMGASGKLLTGIRQLKDDDGNVISEEIETLKAQSVQYVRFLIKTKSIDLVDVFAQFMGIYKDKFQTKIDSI
ncbi:hypothetical protein OMO38_10225 [Chryseobacterium sp. 09-1422]|uniref:Uncharacterized protein n=1 Tax=Chryseobacterium kimseyorum TaxID=2984028 RepID=A0ABT3HYP5_9FLAO|nr:hypothetical protein [Chryseobacterium kimseyorum]MCW3168897.1 hypothetical protein [Chryseobacterium kimseyorum]